MTSESYELQPIFEKSSSAVSQSGDLANYLTIDHEKHNATNGSMQRVGLHDLAADQQNFEVKNSDEERNLEESNCRTGLGCEICLACSVLSGTILLLLGIGIALHQIITTFSS